MGNSSDLKIIFDLNGRHFEGFLGILLVNELDQDFCKTDSCFMTVGIK